MAAMILGVLHNQQLASKIFFFLSQGSTMHILYKAARGLWRKLRERLPLSLTLIPPPFSSFTACLHFLSPPLVAKKDSIFKLQFQELQVVTACLPSLFDYLKNLKNLTVVFGPEICYLREKIMFAAID